jgi:glycosyltransferase involved in cell wall biosynthesis
MPEGKIVFVNRYFSPDESATSRILSDLSFRLAKEGVNVSVVTSRQLYGDARAALPARETIEGVDVHRVATATQGRANLAGRALDYASFHVAAGMKLLSLLQSGDVVVAKTDPPLISIVASRAALWKGALLINWLQDLFPEVASVLTPGLVPKGLGKTLVAARDRTLRRAAMNIVLGETMRERLIAHRVDEAKVRVITNWANVRGTQVISTGDSQTRRALGLENRFVVGYSGNLGRAHEFDTLLGAASRLRSQERFVFLITGGGAKVNALREAVAAQGMQNFVFQNYQPPEMLADSLAAADVHLVSLLPALEGLIVPSKIYGILAAGRPAVFIGDTHGDVARLIDEHECGINVGVGESERLAFQLSALEHNPSRLEAMGVTARRLALKHFSSEHAVEQWLGVLQLVAPRIAGSDSAFALSASRPET